MRLIDEGIFIHRINKKINITSQKNYDYSEILLCRKLTNVTHKMFQFYFEKKNAQIKHKLDKVFK